MSSTRFAILFVLICSVSWTTAQSVAPIWLSPTNVSYDSPDEGFKEQFPERGVWSNISVGAGSRRSGPLLVMDSKKTLWIAFGAQNIETALTTVWNYDPKTDLYRWVAGPGNSSYYRNPGELGVPSPDNAPGRVWSTTATIDHNDNIWFLSYEYCCELWMFNTTSYLFTRMYGPGGVVAVPKLVVGCFVTDSRNNLWILSGDTILNKVWHFNTTSLVLTLVSGNDTAKATTYGDNPYYSGRQNPGCDIDANDRVWLFGGSSLLIPNYNWYSDVWSFDTRTTQWQLERGSNATIRNSAVVVSEDFHPDNLPSARESASVIDRKDGTLIVACGNHNAIAIINDIWLFNKTSKHWKLIYGDPNRSQIYGNFSHYRTPGSDMPSRWLQGTAKGLNVDGDLFMVGGNSRNNTPMNDIWLIPFDHCSNNTTHLCGLNAHCAEEMIGYSCECDEGFVGDGYNCTAIPSPPVDSPITDPPISAPLSSNEPIPSPISNTIASSVSHIFVSWLVLLVIIIQTSLQACVIII